MQVFYTKPKDANSRANLPLSLYGVKNLFGYLLEESSWLIKPMTEDQQMALAYEMVDLFCKRITDSWESTFTIGDLIVLADGKRVVHMLEYSGTNLALQILDSGYVSFMWEDSEGFDGLGDGVDVIRKAKKSDTKFLDGNIRDLQEWTESAKQELAEETDEEERQYHVRAIEDYKKTIEKYENWKSRLGGY